MQKSNVTDKAIVNRDLFRNKGSTSLERVRSSPLSSSHVRLPIVITFLIQRTKGEERKEEGWAEGIEAISRCTLRVRHRFEGDLFDQMYEREFPDESSTP